MLAIKFNKKKHWTATAKSVAEDFKWKQYYITTWTVKRDPQEIRKSDKRECMERNFKMEIYANIYDIAYSYKINL